MEIYQLSDTERAYLAGFLDRSCFIGIIRYLDKGRTKYTVRITVQSSNREVLKPLKSLPNGKIKKTKQSLNWSLAGRKGCAELLSVLLPYLQVRKHVARTVIQFNNEWTRLKYRNGDEIIARRDRLVEQSLGLKFSRRKN